MLTISIVVFDSNADSFLAVLQKLRVAASNALASQPEKNISLTIANNGGLVDYAALAIGAGWPDVGIVSGHGNVGFGRGHNLAMRNMGEYHLILNPDVEIAPDALAVALAFMRDYPQCGLLVPKVFNGKGEREYLCKRYPTVFDLALRGFSPRWLISLFRSRLNHYEMRDAMMDEVVWDPPIVSGCFMLFRADVLRQVGGFDPKFFLYFEDFDISLRAAAVARIAYVPSVKIVHFGGGAAKKGWRHILFFARSAVRFFNKHGWRWC